MKKRQAMLVYAMAWGMQRKIERLEGEEREVACQIVKRILDKNPVYRAVLGESKPL